MCVHACVRVFTNRSYWNKILFDFHFDYCINSWLWIWLTAIHTHTHIHAINPLTANTLSSFNDSKYAFTDHRNNVKSKTMFDRCMAMVNCMGGWGGGEMSFWEYWLIYNATFFFCWYVIPPHPKKFLLKLSLVSKECTQVYHFIMGKIKYWKSTILFFLSLPSNYF